MGGFKAPHGGELINLYLDAEQSAQEKLSASDYRKLDINDQANL